MLTIENQRLLFLLTFQDVPNRSLRYVEAVGDDADYLGLIARALFRQLLDFLQHGILLNGDFLQQVTVNQKGDETMACLLLSMQRTVAFEFDTKVRLELVKQVFSQFVRHPCNLWCVRLRTGLPSSICCCKYGNKA